MSSRALSNVVASGRESRASSFVPYKILYPAPCPKAPAHDTDDDGVKWVGLTSLDMIQKIVVMAEGAAALDALPDSHFDGRSLLEKAFLVDQVGAIETGKRKRGYTEDIIDSGGLTDESFAEALVERYRSVQLDDAFHPFACDAFDGGSHDSLERMVTAFELGMAADSTKWRWLLPSYNRVRAAFLGGGGSADAALHQMEALVKVASATRGRVSTLPPAVSSSMDAQAATDAFTNNLSMWLKYNWKHPYTDETMLKHLAVHLIQSNAVPTTSKDRDQLKNLDPSDYQNALLKLTSEKIANWLVNIRTRRWRPAVEEAFNLRRPASFLLEDSLRIYEGHAVRRLAGWDGDYLFAFDPKYLTDVDSWPKKAKAAAGSKGTKPRANRKSAGSRKSANKTEPMDYADKGSDGMMSAPLDLSPCTEFMKAGGPMMFDVADGDVTMEDAGYAEV